MAVEILHMCMSGGVPMHNTGLSALSRIYAAVLFGEMNRSRKNNKNINVNAILSKISFVEL